MSPPAPSDRAADAGGEPAEDGRTAATTPLAAPLADPAGIPGPTPQGDPVAAAKTVLRRAVHARRRDRLATDPAAVAAAGIAVRDLLLASPEIAALRPGSTVAAYVELRSEVPAAAIREALTAGGIRIVVPVLRPDGDLDWTVAPSPSDSPGPSDSPDSAVPLDSRAAPGDARPAPVLLGPDTITGVAVVLLPGVAADPAGNRLGRGGGSYDRALARLGALATRRRPWTCLLLFADEMVPRVPAGPHDIPVDAVVTPAGLVRTVSAADDD